MPVKTSLYPLRNAFYSEANALHLHIVKKLYSTVFFHTHLGFILRKYRIRSTHTSHFLHIPRPKHTSSAPDRFLHALFANSYPALVVKRTLRETDGLRLLTLNNVACVGSLVAPLGKRRTASIFALWPRCDHASLLTRLRDFWRDFQKIPWLSGLRLR